MLPENYSVAVLVRSARPKDNVDGGHAAGDDDDRSTSSVEILTKGEQEIPMLSIAKKKPPARSRKGLRSSRRKINST